MTNGIKNKLLKEAIKSRVSQTSSGVNKITTSDEIGLTSYDDEKLKSIIINDYIRRGIDPTELSIMSTPSIVTNGLIHVLERVAETQAIQNRESSILTAQKSVTLYNQLIQHTDNILLSSPSEVNVFIRIPFSDFEKFGKHEGNGKWKFVFTTDNTITLDGLPFIPKFDTEILLTKTLISQEIKVQYETEGGYKIIPSQRDLDINGYYYAIIKIPFIQLTIEKTERTFSGKQIERFIIKTQSPIHDFIMTYKDSTMSEPKIIASKLYFTRGSEEYLRYRIHNNSKITLEYIYTPSGFKPKNGGKLSITLLTTSGSNVKYRGEAIVSKRHPDSLTVEYSPVGVEYESHGGKLASDDKEYIRNYIMKLKGSRLRIDTETDLKSYLNVYQGKSSFSPKLVISDLKRVFNVYTLMSFENNGNTFTIPTTSGDILLPLSRLNKEMIDGRPCYNLLNLEIESLQKLGSSMFYLKPTTPTVPDATESIFNYGIPFHLSYDEKTNYIRCMMESQYNVPYDSYTVFDTDSIHTPTRFVNTTLRVNDYEKEDDSKERVFSISTEIRSDNESFKLTSDTFTSEIILMSKDERRIRLPLTKLVDQGKDSKYDLYFDIDTDRKVYGRYFYITAEVETNGTWNRERVLVDIEQSKTLLNLYVKVPTLQTPLLVTTYTADVDLFQDVSKFMYIQSVVTMEGNLKLVLCPLVELDFLKYWRNRSNINLELFSIFRFIDSEIYDENNEYSATGFSLRDRQETLFTTAIKFTKTHGRSKFLQLGELKMLINLQVSPKFKVRLINEQYDINKISSDANLFLTTHDFKSTDLHMNKLVKEVLNANIEDISMLQFVNFGKSYSDIDHLLYHNELNFANDDVPESVSLKPKFDENLGVYVYDVEYDKI